MPSHPLETIVLKKGLTKRGFARACGVNYENSLRWYRPEYDPKMSTVRKWAVVLGIPVVTLVRKLFPEKP